MPKAHLRHDCSGTGERRMLNRCIGGQPRWLRPRDGAIPGHASSLPGGIVLGSEGP